MQIISSMQLLCSEAAVLERLCYKNKNQHRAAQHFQKLLELRRSLQSVVSLHLSDCVSNVQQAAQQDWRVPSGNVAPAYKRARLMGRQESYQSSSLPSPNAARHALQKLIAGKALAGCNTLAHSTVVSCFMASGYAAAVVACNYLPRHGTLLANNCLVSYQHRQP